MHAPLAGKTVWLTRPAHQAQAWADQIEAAGGTALCEPLLAIDPPADTNAAHAALERAADADIVIASSANAVTQAWRLWPAFAPRGALFGVGAASAHALAGASAREVSQPAHCYSSEDLLALEALREVAGLRVAVLAGEGGRTAIADTLAARGARVEKLAVYRRRCLHPGATRLRALLGASDAIVVTSAQTLAQLERLLETLEFGVRHAALSYCVLVAPSARVVEDRGKQLSWTHAPVILERVSGEAVVAALARVRWGNRQ